MADQVGDNVDEINGRGADLFGSFAEATCASLVLSAASDLHIDFCALMYPIFSRFEPNRYYQGLFYMMRRLCMALFPVNFMNEKETQIMMVSMPITVALVAQCILWPWRTDTVNYINATFSASLLLILVGS